MQWEDIAGQEVHCSSCDRIDTVVTVARYRLYIIRNVVFVPINISDIFSQLEFSDREAGFTRDGNLTVATT